MTASDCIAELEKAGNAAALDRFRTLCEDARSHAALDRTWRDFVAWIDGREAQWLARHEPHRLNAYRELFSELERGRQLQLV